MTEQSLIDLLSEESDRMGIDSKEDKFLYDTDISGWKDFSNNSLNIKRSIAEPAKFRIRVINTRGNFIRTPSAKSELSTFSSSNDSGSNSPNTKKDLIRGHAKTNSGNKILSQNGQFTIDIFRKDIFAINQNTFKVLRTPNYKKQIIRLPVVKQIDKD